MISRLLMRATLFRDKMILIFLVMTVIPFAVFGYYAYVNSLEGIKRASAAASMDYLVQTKKNFDQYLFKLNDQINDLISDPQLQQMMLQVPQSSEEEALFTSNMINLIYQNMNRVDSFRINIFPVDPLHYQSYIRTLGMKGDLKEQSWYKLVSRNETPIWHLFKPEETQYGRPLLSKIKFFKGMEDMVPRGIMVTDLSSDQLRQYLAPVQQKNALRLYLLNQQGEVLFDSTAGVAGSPVESAALLDIARSDGEGTETLQVNDISQLVTYVRMDAEPWSIVSTIPLAELTAPIAETNKMLFSFLFIYILLCVAVVFYITVKFTNPIVRLVRSMNKIEQGKVNTRLPQSARKDEIGWLYSGFHTMIKTIESLIEQAALAERTKKELEFQVLSHQINPHFLYNTLESIRWKAEYHKMKDISEMVASLGNLLRLSLNEGKEITTVGREIEQVKAYVRIEQARLGKPLRILFSVEEEILHLPFLRLLLQPLVENAIHHGIRDDLSKGKILLHAYKEREMITIELTDNGPGIPQSVLQRLMDAEASNEQGKRRGVGLSNVNERLKLYFGEAFQLIIESDGQTGTKITVKHPILPE